MSKGLAMKVSCSMITLLFAVVVAGTADAAVSTPMDALGSSVPTSGLHGQVARRGGMWIAGNRKVVVAVEKKKKLSHGYGGSIGKTAQEGQGGEESQMFKPGCIPAELCMKKKVLCFKVCANSFEKEPEKCPVKCVKCIPTC